MPASFAASILPAELAPHGWDLAQSSGQPGHIFDDLVAYLRGPGRGRRARRPRSLVRRRGGLRRGCECHRPTRGLRRTDCARLRASNTTTTMGRHPPTHQRKEDHDQVRVHVPRADDPADAAPPESEQMEAVMAEWNAWAGRVGDRMVDFGTPLAGGVRVTPDGTVPKQPRGGRLQHHRGRGRGPRPALELAQGHPHPNMPGGCEIEVHEAQAIPGM